MILLKITPSFQKGFAHHWIVISLLFQLAFSTEHTPITILLAHLVFQPLLQQPASHRCNCKASHPRGTTALAFCPFTSSFEVVVL